MSQSTTPESQANNEFDAAKTIVATLKGLDKQQQERAIRFATETLGLHATAPTLPAGGTPAVALTPAHTVHTPEVSRPLDIKQFTRSKSPKTDQQFAAIVAYYYRFEAPVGQRCDTINQEVLQDAARLADRKRPSRMTLHNAKNSGYLDALGGGEFKLNTVGENLVAITLPGNNDAPRKKSAKTRTSNKSPKKRQMKKVP